MALTVRRRVIVVALVTMVLSVAVWVGVAMGPSATAFAQAPLVPVTFQLNFTAGGYNAGFAFALQQGYYKREGLDVKIEKGQGSGITAQLVAGGKADIGYADALAVMQLIAKGAPMKVVATIYQSNPNAVTVLTTSDIKTIQQLKGHSVGTPSGQSQSAMIPILFKANGLSDSDVKLVSMPGTAMVATLLQHQVDAILGSLDAYSIQLHQRGVETRDFAFGDYGVATVSTSVIASNAYLAQHGDVVSKFIKASLDGWNDAIKHPEDAIKALQQTFPADTEPARNLAELKAAIALVCKNNAKFVGKAEPEAWAQTTSVAQQVLDLPTTLPATAYYTYEALPSALPTSCPIR
jgi:NitT/TauT family transport system substrate-binding protein